MGWSFAMTRSHKKADVIARVRSGRFFAEGYRLIEDRIVGNHLWGVMEQPDGIKTIALVLMAGGGKDMGWGYKSITESWGPCELDCPLSLLDKVDPPTNDHARAWRDKVIEHHRLMGKKKKVIAPGQTVTLNNQQYTLIEPYAPRKGWLVKHTETGQRYRMKAKDLARAAMSVARILPPTQPPIAQQHAMEQEPLFA